MAETSAGVITRYLQDAIAAEKGFEGQLKDFANEADSEAVKSVFLAHALQTKKQYERLSLRLEALGGSTSATRNLLAQIFGSGAKVVHIGQRTENRTTQNLIVAFAIGNSNIALYESLAAFAEAAGDVETESLARSTQAEEKAATERLWCLLRDAALLEAQRAANASA